MAPPRRADRERGLELIILYKLAKGAIQLLAAAALFSLELAGGGTKLQSLAMALYDHATGAWSLRLASLLVRATAPEYVRLATAALALDGVLSSVEGWALRRGYGWGPWLVVGATALLLPFEVVAVTERPRLTRAVALAVNVAVVAYLVARARAHRRAHPR